MNVVWDDRTPETHRQWGDRCFFREQMEVVGKKICKILQGYKQHGKNHWEKTFGKNFDGLIAEWRQMETIYDPVFQWTYNGTADGVVRHDKGFCSLGSLRADDTSDKSGAWLDGKLAALTGMKVSGNLEMREGSRLRLPANPELAFVQSISVKGEGSVVLKPGAATRQGRFQKIMRTGEAPRDLARFRLAAGDDEKAATFKGAPSGSYLGVTPHK